jgi:hypothetical protein
MIRAVGERSTSRTADLASPGRPGEELLALPPLSRGRPAITLGISNTRRHAVCLAMLFADEQ